MLPAPQRALWSELAAIPSGFVLYGGTGLALRLAHRASIDFDFFAHDALDHDALISALPWLRTARTLQESANTKTVLADGDVKVSFFGGIEFGRVGDPDGAGNGAVQIASLADLAGTKIKALLQRVEAKDYLDVFALLRDGMALETILGAGQTLFGAAFNPIVACKALCYFEGGDLDTLPEDVKHLLTTEAARDIDVKPLPRTSQRLD
jgi:hypothetical protein